MKGSIEICNNVIYAGASDFRLKRFENLFPVPDGVSYNSYLIADEKTAVIDGVDAAVAGEFLYNVSSALNSRALDYIIVQHMEPDHSASLFSLVKEYPNARLVMSARAKAIFENFFGAVFSDRIIIVKDGEELSLGKSTLKFIFAPMVHWPEVMVTYDETDKLLFSADAFGSFGAVAGDIFDDNADFYAYSEEMRRYYSNIVGKYGAQVNLLLDKAARLDIRAICPLHGRIIRKNLSAVLEKYKKWANYEPESEGVFIAYSSMYGNTKRAAFALADEIAARGAEVEISDVSSKDISYLVSSAFKFRRIVLLSVTYNGGIYPKTEAFINDMKALGLKDRIFGFIENGSWAPMSAKLMRASLSELKGCAFSDEVITLRSAFKREDESRLGEFAERLLQTDLVE